MLVAARRLLEEQPSTELTLRRLADELGIRPPSLYKHFAGRQAIEAALIEVAFTEIGTTLRAAVAAGDAGGAAGRLLGAYRRAAADQPGLYRLATSGRLPRHLLPAGLEEWAGEPFYTVTGDPHRAQALWAFAHGMVMLEIDGRFPEGSDLDRTWAAGTAALASPGSKPRPAGRGSGPRPDAPTGPTPSGRRLKRSGTAVADR